MHWTQMPGGKEKMAKAQKKAWATKRRQLQEDNAHVTEGYSMSDEGRSRISEGMKRLHAVRRREEKKYSHTSEGKAKISKAMKDRWAASREAQFLLTNRNNHASSQQEIPEDIFAYALGHIECWIETFSKSSDVSYEVLTAKLGEVLQSKSVR